MALIRFQTCNNGTKEHKELVWGFFLGVAAKLFVLNLVLGAVLEDPVGVFFQDSEPSKDRRWALPWCSSDLQGGKFSNRL